MREGIMGISIKVEHNGTEYHAETAIIRKTELYREDHGIFTAGLRLDMKGSGVVAGNYTLDEPVFKEVEGRKQFSHRRGTAFGMDHIIRIVETAGVGSWEDLPGTNILLLQDKPWGTVKGIASIDGERVMIFGEHFTEFEAELANENLSATR